MTNRADHRIDHLPALVIAAGDRASIRFLQFFAATVRNKHAGRA